MNYKKQYLSPILTSIAMIMLLISRLISERSMDWLGYLAIAVLVTSIISIIMMYRQSVSK
jgi:ABC-type bacteriocin/lantibiotic exporter with double-glycine peptidase domain